MFAIVKDRDGIPYVSPVFAISGDEHPETRVIVCSPDFEWVICTKMWHIKKVENLSGEKSETVSRRVFIYDMTLERPALLNGWRGLDLLVNNEQAMARICERPVMLNDVEWLKEYAEKRDFPDWIKIENALDIFSFMQCSERLRGASPASVKKFDGGFELELCGISECALSMRFEGVSSDKISGNVGTILDAQINKLENGFEFVVLRGYEGWIDGVEFEEIQKPLSLKCKSLLWNIKVS